METMEMEKHVGLLCARVGCLRAGARLEPPFPQGSNRKWQSAASSSLLGGIRRLILAQQSINFEALLRPALQEPSATQRLLLKAYFFAAVPISFAVLSILQTGNAPSHSSPADPTHLAPRPLAHPLAFLPHTSSVHASISPLATSLFLSNPLIDSQFLDRQSSASPFTTPTLHRH